MYTSSNFYNSKIRSIARMGILLALLILLKWKFGFYDEIDGVEITTGFFLTISLFINKNELFLLTTSFLLSCLFFYGFYTFLGYVLFFYITGFIVNHFKKFFLKNQIIFIFTVFAIISTFWIWWIPVDWLYLNSLKLALLRILTGWYINILEGIVNFGFIIVFLPTCEIIFKKFSINTKNIGINNKKLVRKNN